MTRGPRRQQGPNRDWWRAFAWTVTTIIGLNLMLGYLVARAVFPAASLSVQPLLLIAWALVCLVGAFAAALSWRIYLRNRRIWRAQADSE